LVGFGLSCGGIGIGLLLGSGCIGVGLLLGSLVGGFGRVEQSKGLLGGRHIASQLRLLLFR
jgi:hypothetical protein